MDGPSPGWLALAAAIVAGGVAFGWQDTPEPETAPTAPVEAASVPIAATPASAPMRLAQASPAGVAAAPASSPAAPRIPRVREPDGDQTPDITDYINPGEVPTMGEVITRLRQAGVHTGLAAFNPPGTRPPLVGLAVPEDFALPPGYVRHYQATDDGQRIEPVLMFSPDHVFLDAAGRPVAVPADRVVPPEMAPPGLPLRRIQVPAPVEPGRR